MQASKRVIILDHINSTRISQAIFILSDGAADDFSAVQEAERLVADFLGGTPLLVPKKKNFLRLLSLAALAGAALAAAAFLIYIF